MLGKNSKLCFGISIGALIVAVVLAAWGFPKIVSKQIQKSIQLENSSMMFEKWRVLPMPLDFKINVFNVTNVDEINSGKKPKLTEVGPYVYKEYREKIILGYGDNDTIRYMLKKTFHFDAKESGSLTEDDLVTVINFPYMAAILTVSYLLPSMVPTMNAGFEEMHSNLTDAFHTVRVKDLLFDGIYLNCRGNSALGLICAQIAADVPSTMRRAEDGKGFYFSMFSHLNRTESGPYDMVRGREDINELGHIVAFKDSTFMNQWGQDPYCGQLNGSDGSIFPPINEKNVPQRLYTFQPDICRSIYVAFKGKSTLFNMTAYYYEFSESAFAAKSANPDNKCFCKLNWSANHDGCLLMGLLNLLPCQKAPVIVSMPHFYLASEELLEFFDSGISPDKEKHNTYIYLEPVTGGVMKGVQRLQFNVELRRMDVPQLQNVPTGLFPLLWIEERAEIPESIQEELSHSHTLLGYVEAARWAILAIAILSLLVSAIFVARSGAIPMWPRNNNSVSFVLRPSNGHGFNSKQ